MPGTVPTLASMSFRRSRSPRALLYYLYGAVDRLGLESQRDAGAGDGEAVRRRIDDLQHRTSSPAGRGRRRRRIRMSTWSGSISNGEATGGAVTPQLYESLQPGDLVQVEFQRTRFSKQIVVTDVRR